LSFSWHYQRLQETNHFYNYLGYKALDEIDGYEQEANVRFKAKWYSLSEFEKSSDRLVPEELAKLLFS